MHPRDDGTFLVAVSDGTRWGSTIVDANGVRLDDSITARVFGRLGRFGLLAFAAGMLLLLWIAFSLGSELGAARALDAPGLGQSGPVGASLSALEGTLRIGEETKLHYRVGSAWRRFVGRAGAGWLVPSGDAWVEADAGAIRLRLPDRPIEVLEGSPDGWSGRTVVVLSRFEGFTTTGLRSASMAWPDDAVLTLGVRADAADALVRRAVRRAASVAFPTVAALGTAAATLVLSL